MDKKRGVGPVRIGALELRSFFPDDPDADAWAGTMLFDSSSVILSGLRKQVKAAGFPQYPASKTEPLEVTAQRFTGAAPKAGDAADIRASHAFALLKLAQEEYKLAVAMERGDGGSIWRSGVRMGQIAEWWRWRREGHDLDAFMHSERRRTGSEGGRQRGRIIRSKREPLFREIEQRLANGAQIGSLCRSMVRRGKYSGKADSLETAFRRWSKDRDR